MNTKYKLQDFLIRKAEIIQSDKIFSNNAKTLFKGINSAHWKIPAKCIYAIHMRPIKAMTSICAYGPAQFKFEQHKQTATRKRRHAFALKLGQAHSVNRFGGMHFNRKARSGKARCILPPTTAGPRRRLSNRFCSLFLEPCTAWQGKLIFLLPIMVIKLSIYQFI